MSKHLMRHNSLASSNVDLGISENILVGLATLGGVYAADKLATSLLGMLMIDNSKPETMVSFVQSKRYVSYGVETLTLGLGAYEAFMNDNKDVGIPVAVVGGGLLALEAYDHYKTNKFIEDKIAAQEKASGAKLTAKDKEQLEASLLTAGMLLS
jgi:hypothetical protein